jgi:hypothetical protein
MTDIQALFNHLAAGAKAESLADKPIITLGELIAKLEQQDADAPLAVEFYGNHFACADLGSYRGYYSDLAIEPDGNLTGTVADALTKLRGAVGKTFHGYKGGDYTMSNRTIVWVSNYGDNSGIGVTGVEVRDGLVVITSADCEN